MNVWKIVCATLVIFVAGIVTGAVLVRIGERGTRGWTRPPREAINRPQFNPPNNPNNPPLGNNPGRPGDPQTLKPNAPNAGPLSREFVASLESQLQLTPEQREQVNKIMSEGQERIRELRRNIDPEIRKEMQKTHEQIQAVLTVEQREQFQRLMKQRLQRRDSPNQTDRRPREPREPQEFRDQRNPPPPLDDARNPGPQVP